MFAMTRTDLPAVAYATDDDRWQAVQRRDRSADAAFVYAVRSTGVYCRPSCAARLAQRQNVSFHASGSDAELAGFRPCKRCKPDQAVNTDGAAGLIAAACRSIAAAETIPPLESLAAEAGLSPAYFHRLFKAVTGITPRGFAERLRAQRLQAALHQGDASVTQALYDAGFNSSGRFYEAADQLLGMTPTAYRRGGAANTIRFAIADCALGVVLVAQSDRGLCAILLGDEPESLLRDLQDRFPRAELVGHAPGFDQVVAAVVTAIREPARAVSLPLDIRGTAFQQRVWQALRLIPPGHSASYSQVATQLGLPRAARAVAAACAANPLAVLVPCHRVVRQDGSLAGYRWGLGRKRALRDRERAK